MADQLEYEFDTATNMLRVWVNSVDPNIKGVRAKAQKWLKEMGVWDATCWFEDFTPLVGTNGGWATFKITSAQLALRQLNQDMNGGLKI